jgi:hypothetical protein
MRPMRILARLILFSGYATLSLGVVFLFGGGPAGGGTFLPVVIISSWAVPITRLVWPTGVGAIIFFILYYGFLFNLTTRSAHSKIINYPLITWTIHCFGVAVALLTKEKEENPPITPLWLVYLVSFTMVLLYLWVDWRLERADTRGRKEMRRS